MVRLWEPESKGAHWAGNGPTYPAWCYRERGRNGGERCRPDVDAWLTSLRDCHRSSTL